MIFVKDSIYFSMVKAARQLLAKQMAEEMRGSGMGRVVGNDSQRSWNNLEMMRDMMIERLMRTDLMCFRISTLN